MELKYLVGQYLGKKILFLITVPEEKNLREHLKNTPCVIFFAGKWEETEEAQTKSLNWFFKINRWVVTSELIDSYSLSSLICNAHVSGKKVIDLETFFLELEPLIPASPQQLIHLLTTKGATKDPLIQLYSHLRYAIEPPIALLVLLALSPILAVVAMAVKLTSPGPIIYTQKRVGYRGKLFNIYKFRSMTENAEKGGALWAQASRTDSRLTPIGGFLRSTHLDELPQFWNVLRGEVSFIGPRPERPEFVKELASRYPLFRLRPLVKPGITGWAQVHQGYANSYSDSLRKLELDLFYIIKFSLFLDLKIVAKTILVLAMGGTEGLKRARSTTS